MNLGLFSTSTNQRLFVRSVNPYGGRLQDVVNPKSLCFTTHETASCLRLNRCLYLNFADLDTFRHALLM